MPTPEEIQAVGQIKAAKLITAADMTADEVLEIANTEGRKHVLRALGRKARKLGYTTLDGLVMSIEDTRAAAAKKAAKGKPTKPKAPSADTKPVAKKPTGPSEAQLAMIRFKAMTRENRQKIERFPARVVNKTNPHTCPRCDKTASTAKQVEDRFGTRATVAHNSERGLHYRVIPQSYCRTCRNAHKRRKTDAPAPTN